MDPFSNPFSPGAGTRPPELAGRDDVLMQAKMCCRRAVNGKHARPQMLLGLRGTGKTVLLNEIQKIGEEEGLLISKFEAPENANLSQFLVPQMQKVMRSLSFAKAANQFAVRGLRGLRNFASVFKVSAGGVDFGIESEPGLADSGNLEIDLPDLFEAIGKAAQAAKKGWLLLIDEVQYLNEADLSALIVSLHQMSQVGLPVVFVGAGLPQIAQLAGEAKSYSERLFSYHKIDALDEASAERAVKCPIEDEGVRITSDALRELTEKTQGYPFFLQEWASKAWDHAVGPEISLQEIQDTYSETIYSLDEGFFKVRLDRLTPAETQFVNSMAKLGDGPYQTSEIASTMGKKISSLGPARANIIKKGMIYSTDHGYLDFTVPLFADYLRRHKP